MWKIGIILLFIAGCMPNRTTVIYVFVPIQVGAVPTVNKELVTAQRDVPKNVRATRDPWYADPGFDTARVDTWRDDPFYSDPNYTANPTIFTDSGLDSWLSDNWRVNDGF